MESPNWYFERTLSHKLQGYVWNVFNSEGKKGYFKFATADQWYYSGPLVANEFVASHLASRLGFPVGELQEAVVKGPDGTLQHGVVSVAVCAPEVTTWGSVSYEVIQRPKSFIHNISLLSTLVVFDAWTANIDRATGKNIVLYRYSSSEKYQWYLIDHALTLFGAPCKWEGHPWNSRYWQQIWKFYHVPKGFLKLQSAKTVLEPMITRIENLSEEIIIEALSKVPRGTLDENERGFILKLLLHRKNELRKMIYEWLEYHGVKEYQF